VIAVTYPSIFKPGSSGGLACPSIGALGGDDVQWLIDETFHLDDAIVEAARQAGVQVLDERYALAGHELCSASSWVNGLLQGGTSITDASPWFHPTANGYTAIAQSLQARVGSGSSIAGRALPKAPPAWTWTNPLPGVPDAIDAHFLATNMVVTAPSTVPYRNGQFGWPQIIRMCSQRDRILQRDALAFHTAPVSPPTVPVANCVVDSGRWQSPYDATTLNPTTLAAVSSQVQIDHVISQRDAWLMGAAAWTAKRRAVFGNDFFGLELLTVGQPINGSKSDQTVETWLPPNAAFQCYFLEMYASVKYQYGLGVTANEKNRLVSLLLAC
jgi:hypothetical protein